MHRTLAHANGEWFFAMHRTLAHTDGGCFFVMHRTLAHTNGWWFYQWGWQSADGGNRRRTVV